MYPADADYFGDYALSFRESGACVVGGCCGTTPQHIAVMKKALASSEYSSVLIQTPDILEITETSDVEPPTQFAQKLGRGEFAIAVEMDPPRGLSTHKLLAGASPLAHPRAGVNKLADFPMAPMRNSAWAGCD